MGSKPSADRKEDAAPAEPGTGTSGQGAPQAIPEHLIKQMLEKSEEAPKTSGEKYERGAPPCSGIGTADALLTDKQ